MSIFYSLLPSECDKKNANMQKSLMICSFYEQNGLSSDSSLDIELITSRIRTRTEKVLNANPWCMGRIVSETEHTVQIEYDAEKHDFDQNFQVVKNLENDRIFEATDYQVLAGLLDKYCLPIGSEIIDKDQPHMRITVLASQTASKICIIGSFNHISFDATTFYSIWGMMNDSNEIISLDRNAVENFTEKLKTETSLLAEKDLSYEDSSKFLFSVFGPALKVKNQFYHESARQGKLECMVKKINPEYIDSKKKLFNTDKNFVSTNDIIHSWVSDICPVADNMMIAVNCRNRVSGVSNSHAGNYLTAGGPLLFNKDMDTPESSRNWIRNISNPNFSWKTPNSIKVEHSQSFVGGLVSNWSSCYKQIEIPGFTHKLHLPVFTMRLKIMDMFCVVFKSGKDDLAMMLVHGRDEITKEVLEANALLGLDLINSCTIDAEKL